MRPPRPPRLQRAAAAASLDAAAVLRTRRRGAGTGRRPARARRCAQSSPRALTHRHRSRARAATRRSRHHPRATTTRDRARCRRAHSVRLQGKRQARHRDARGPPGWPEARGSRIIGHCRASRSCRVAAVASSSSSSSFSRDRATALSRRRLPPNRVSCAPHAWRAVAASFTDCAISFLERSIARRSLRVGSSSVPRAARCGSLAARLEKADGLDREVGTTPRSSGCAVGWRAL